MNFHPASLLFPMMSDAELNELAADIKKNGLIEPVVLYHGEVLDGRNRLKACELAGIEPKFTETNGDVPSPTLYALSKNMHRRHLSTSQKAAVAAKTVPLLAEEAKLRQISALKRGSESPLTPIGVNGARADELAARSVGVGHRTVTRAVSVMKESPEEFERVLRGEITVNAAANEQEKRHRREGREPQKHGGQVPKTVDTPRGHQLAQADKRRMVDGLATLGGMCAGMEALKIDMIVAVCSVEEINTWATKAETHARELRKFAAKLRGAKNGESTSLQESEGQGRLAADSSLRATRAEQVSRKEAAREARP